MELSTRNQLKGQVKSVKTDSVTAEVVVDIGGGQEMVALITASSVARLKIKTGDKVIALVKATSVMIAK